MTLHLTSDIAEKAAQFPESSHGATTVTLVLANGTHISNVVLAWGREIVKVGSRHIYSVADLGFSPHDIKDVLPASGSAV